MNKGLAAVFISIISVLVILYWWQNRITISVIMPVYNAEKYLAKCLDSIFIQSGSFEVIAVNNGSTDSSLQILQQYAQKHSNLKIINQENEGISSARNAGIHLAKNKYITFIDGKDKWEAGAFSKAEKMLKKDKSDVLLTNLYDVYDRQWVKDTRGDEAAQKVPEESKFPRRGMEKLALFSPFNAEDTINDLYYEGTSQVLHSFYKRNFLKKNSLEFPDKINKGEDIIFMLQVYAHNPLISILNIPIYNHYNRTEDIQKSLSNIATIQDSIDYMHQSAEYQKSSRYIQIQMDDVFIAIIFKCMIDLEKHNALTSNKIEEIYSIYATMLKYNQYELKSARNYQKTKSYLQQIGFNQPL